MRHANFSHTPLGILLLAVGYFNGLSCQKVEQAPMAQIIELKEGWFIQAASEITEGGHELSVNSIGGEGWYSTSVPRTVLASLVDNGEYPDPYFARNLENIPLDRFAQPWWYQTSFELTDDQAARHARLIFEGINFRANVWLNGVQIANSESLFGSFRLFDLEIAGKVHPGTNHLAVEVLPPEPGELTIGFVDWNPTPPDRNMGLWRGVHLRLSGPISIEDPFVKTDLDLETLEEALITVETKLHNHSDQTVEGSLILNFAGSDLRKEYSIPPNKNSVLAFSPDEFSELRIKNPRLWWPNNLGEPVLHSLELITNQDGRVSDRQEVTFGIREVADYINDEGHRGYTVNGKKLLIRGAGWVDDLMLADDYEKVAAQMRYAREMGLNTIRLEGFWGSDSSLYDLADEHGILLMAGWSCHWEWENYLGKPVDEFGGIETAEEMQLITRSLGDQVLWLRNHPSLLVWVFGSDMLPRPQLERNYLELLDEIDPTRPTLSACSIRESEVSGKTAVKMNGPYDYVPPNYWYVDREHGGAYGFNTETGPGPQPPPIDSIKRMIPEENLWPIDDMWDYHSGRNEFNTMKRYLHAFDRRYGESKNLEDFALWAQVANYEAVRAMFEAFGANKHNATGVIQWMLNSAWPETFWQLYDWYLMPNGAYFGTKAGSQPLNLVYDYGDRSISLVNDTLEERNGMTVDIRVLNLRSEELLNRSLEVDVSPNSSRKVFEMPEISGLRPVYFIFLELSDQSGTEISRNTYWLSSKEDVLDFENTLWFVTPNKSFADFRALRSLPKAEVSSTTSVIDLGKEKAVVVNLRNESDSLAFFLELKLVGQGSNEPILPVYWEDNYVTLLPNEERSVSCKFSPSVLKGETPELILTGTNLQVQD